MSDKYEGTLEEELRDISDLLDRGRAAIFASIFTRAADALEARDKRIAELEAKNQQLKKRIRELKYAVLQTSRPRENCVLRNKED